MAKYRDDRRISGAERRTQCFKKKGQKTLRRMSSSGNVAAAILGARRWGVQRTRTSSSVARPKRNSYEALRQSSGKKGVAEDREGAGTQAHSPLDGTPTRGRPTEGRRNLTGGLLAPYTESPKGGKRKPEKAEQDYAPGGPSQSKERSDLQAIVVKSTENRSTPSTRT